MINIPNNVKKFIEEYFEFKVKDYEELYDLLKQKTDEGFIFSKNINKGSLTLYIYLQKDYNEISIHTNSNYFPLNKRKICNFYITNSLTVHLKKKCYGLIESVKEVEKALDNYKFKKKLDRKYKTKNIKTKGVKI